MEAKARSSFQFLRVVGVLPETPSKGSHLGGIIHLESVSDHMYRLQNGNAFCHTWISRTGYVRAGDQRGQHVSGFEIEFDHKTLSSAAPRRILPGSVLGSTRLSNRYGFLCIDVALCLCNINMRVHCTPVGERGNVSYQKLFYICLPVTMHSVQSHTKMSSPFDFFRIIETLKETPRKGWLLRGISSPESVSDHMYRMAIMMMMLPDVSSGQFDDIMLSTYCLLYRSTRK